MLWKRLFKFFTAGSLRNEDEKKQSVSFMLLNNTLHETVCVCADSAFSLLTHPQSRSVTGRLSECLGLPEASASSVIFLSSNIQCEVQHSYLHRFQFPEMLYFHILFSFLSACKQIKQTKHCPPPRWKSVCYVLFPCL